jgi:hypothetical protein
MSTRGRLNVVFQRPLGGDALRLKVVVVAPDGIERIDLTVGQQSQLFDEGQLIFGLIDFASEEGRPGSMSTSIVEHLKGIPRGT